MCRSAHSALRFRSPLDEAFDQFAHQVLSGSRRGPGAALLRAGLSLVEPAYVGVTAARNALFDLGLLPVRKLPRPVVSVGNLTTGGTGKTPIVRWLAESLQNAGRHVGVVARGYKSKPGTLGDEQKMLDRQLAQPGLVPVQVRANPRRFDEAMRLIDEHPEIELLLLDDGFQHRKVARDLDIVLLSAIEPFGYGRVLPRGLLRERLAALRRAGAIVLTHADTATPPRRFEIEREVRRHNAHAPFYQASHALSQLLDEHDTPLPLEALADQRWFAFCGIGSPHIFFEQLRSIGGQPAGTRALADHQYYNLNHITALADEARASGAQVLVTTEKDWAKILPLLADARLALPLLRADMQVRFAASDGDRLLAQVSNLLCRP